MEIRSVADVGSIVREERRSRGITQAELAADAGVGVKFLIRLEQGHPGIEVGRVFAVLEELGIALTADSDRPVVPSSESETLLDSVFDALEGGGDDR